MFHKLVRNRKDNRSIMIVPKELKCSFNPEDVFKDSIIRRVFQFAYEMSYGEGFHRDSRSGGVSHRKPGEIFASTFQGKLAECAVYNLLHHFKNKSEIDFNIYGKGVWDDADLFVNNKTISIKSSKSFSQLFLLETEDWDEYGRYLPNAESGHTAYDYFIFVRIAPSVVDLLKKNQLLYSHDVIRDDLFNIIDSEEWSYEISGYLTKDDLVNVIHSKHIIHRGEYLNTINTKMDADNYYVLLHDLRNIHDLIKEVKQYE